MNKKGDVLVIDWKDAGQLPQPFEHHHEHNLVVFPDRVEYRQLEQLELGMTKYVIHTEKFPGVPERKINTQGFMQAFNRTRALDPVDIRKAIRWALKAFSTYHHDAVCGIVAKGEKE